MTYPAAIFTVFGRHRRRRLIDYNVNVCDFDRACGDATSGRYSLLNGVLRI